MGSLSLSIQYEKNIGLVYNIAELKELYFTGIDLQDQFGNPIPEETIKFYIEAAQKEVQDQLEIKLVRQAIFENKDFVNDDYNKWGYIPLNYPCVKGFSVQGFLNSSIQIDYPKEWLSSKQSSDPDLYWRSVNLVAINGPGVSLSNNAVFVGLTPYIGFFGARQIPNYWYIKYLTGFKKIPADILNYIGRLATNSLLLALGDIILGVGVANKSISVDGLSQSIGSTASAMYNLFGARISQNNKDMETQLPLLRARYTGFNMGVL
jgi:hypothetical protein